VCRGFESLPRYQLENLKSMNRSLLYGIGLLIAAAAIPYLGELRHQPPSLLLESLIFMFGLLGLSLMVFGFTKLTQRWGRIVLGIYLAGVMLMLVATPAGLLYAQASSNWTLIGRVTMTDLFWPLVLVIKALAYSIILLLKIFRQAPRARPQWIGWR
jgi:MFS family permease